MLSDVNTVAIVFTAVFWIGTAIYTVYQIFKLSKQKRRNEKKWADSEKVSYSAKKIFENAQRQPNLSETEDEMTSFVNLEEGEKHTAVMFDDISRGERIYIKFAKIAGVPSDQIRYITKSKMSIGRNKACDIAIEDKWISRWHANIIYENKKLFICDEGSRNGTIVEGCQLAPHQATVLKDGSAVRMGNTEFQIYMLNNGS